MTVVIDFLLCMCMHASFYTGGTYWGEMGWFRYVLIKAFVTSVCTS
jgi:hypothetical protein